MTKTDELERQKKARLDIAPDQPKLASRIDQMQAVDPEPLRETVGDLRPARGRADLKRPNFSAPVPANGYALWYIEGSSLCGKYQTAVIGRVDLRFHIKAFGRVPGGWRMRSQSKSRSTGRAGGAMRKARARLCRSARPLG